MGGLVGAGHTTLLSETAELGALRRTRERGAQRQAWLGPTGRGSAVRSRLRPLSFTLQRVSARSVVSVLAPSAGWLALAGRLSTTTARRSPTRRPATPATGQLTGDRLRLRSNDSGGGLKRLLDGGMRAEQLLVVKAMCGHHRSRCG